MAEEIVLEDVEADLVRVQTFDPESLIQRERLGEDFAFDGAVEPARRLVSLFMKLPKEAIREFPAKQLQLIQKTTKSAFALFQEILSFNSKAPDAETRQTQLITNLEAAYQQNFDQLFPFISFAVARTVDFNKLAEEGRAAVQSVRDESNKIVGELDETSDEAKRVLQEVRDAAAEQGVTQQAKYFGNEAELHESRAVQWRNGSFGMALLVLFYSGFTLFFPQFEVFSADSTGEAIQLTASKVLIFFVLASVLFIFIRNFNAHKHNAVLNKHRQNALMTYRTLAEAGGSVEARDTVLQHAAAAVYAPADTGFVKHEERGYSGASNIGFTARVPQTSPASLGTTDS